MQRTGTLVLTLAMATASLLSGQSVPRETLSRADASFPEPFSSIRGLRELSDGRVVIADRLEVMVAIIDFSSGDRVSVAKQGQGPGEYGTPGQLFALAGDTTFMVDFGNFRGLIILPDGSVGETVVLRPSAELMIIPRGADSRGRIYAQPPRLSVGGSRSSSDSAAIVRFDLHTQVIDTVRLVPFEGMGGGGVSVSMVRVGGGGGGGALAGGPKPYQPQDSWAVTRAGRLAIVHADPYRVEWIEPGGDAIMGPQVSYEPVRVGKAEKEEWAERQGSGTMMMRTNQGGSRTVQAPRPDIDDQDWPTHKPAFETTGVYATPAGEIWVRRSQRAGDLPWVLDVFDQRGRLVKQVTLPQGHRISGFGDGTMYTAHRDADDLEWLERFRLR
jgi:hypothetical protein